MSDPKGHTIQVVSGPAGPSLYLDDYRIAGPKPWGGGTVLYEFAFKDKDLTAAGVTLDPRPDPASHDCTSPCGECGGGCDLGHTVDCPAVAGDRGDGLDVERLTKVMVRHAMQEPFQSIRAEAEWIAEWYAAYGGPEPEDTPMRQAIRGLVNDTIADRRRMNGTELPSASGDPLGATYPGQGGPDDW